VKIGLLGGTFNPIHTGHLALASECCARLILDKVFFIPAYVPPHKEVEGDASALDRLNMVRLALGKDKRYEASSYEIDCGRTSYSIDTIRYFKKTYSTETNLFFLTGADVAGELSTWKDVDTILGLTTFVVASRPGWKELTSYEQKIKRLEIPPVKVSSSVIRDMIRKRKDVSNLIPDEVLQYIQRHGLYR